MDRDLNGKRHRLITGPTSRYRLATYDRASMMQQVALLDSARLTQQQLEQARLSAGKRRIEFDKQAANGRKAAAAEIDHKSIQISLPPPALIQFISLRRDATSRVSLLPKDLLDYYLVPMCSVGLMRPYNGPKERPWTNYAVCHICCGYTKELYLREFLCPDCPRDTKELKICAECKPKDYTRQVCGWHRYLPGEPLAPRLCWSCLGTERHTTQQLSLCEGCTDIVLAPRCADCMWITCTECAWHRDDYLDEEGGCRE
jgi:hypothetical protein